MADAFSQHRQHLFGVAYRMLGSRADAEDVVQEAWLRYAAAAQEDIVDLRAWLTTVTGRLCLDQLRSARVRREAYVGPWLPEPLVERLPDESADPGEAVTLTESVSIALLLILDTLTPEQRVAFVLHDVFAVPFAEVADTLRTSPENARQLASRARRTVSAGERRHSTSRARQAEVLAAFMAAATDGDLDALLKVLAPDVVALGDGGGTGPSARRPVVGALPVARFVLGLFRQAAKFEFEVLPALVNGDLGMVVKVRNATWPGLPPDAMVVSSLSISPEGLVTGVFNQLNPAKLAALGNEF